MLQERIKEAGSELPRAARFLRYNNGDCLIKLLNKIKCYHNTTYNITLIK